jgi:hypothetical protein
MFRLGETAISANAPGPPKVRKIGPKAFPLGYPWEPKTAKRPSREVSKKVLKFCTPAGVLFEVQGYPK